MLKFGLQRAAGATLAPKAPVLAGPTGTNIGPLGATFSWSGSTSNVPLTYSLVVDGKTGPTGLTKTSSYVPLSVGAHTSKVLAVAGSTFTPSNTVSVTIPIFKPIAPVLAGPTGRNLGPLGATLSWSGSTSNVPLSYSLVVDGKTGPIGLTGTSRFVSLSPGAHTSKVLAVAGSTFTSSNTVSVDIPIFKPIAPVLAGPTGPLVGLTGATFSWSGSTSNVPLTYSLVVDSVTGPTGLTGTSRFVGLSPGPTHSARVVAVAGTTFTPSNTVSVTIPIFKPIAPVLSGPTGSLVGLTGATFRWSGSTSNVPLTYSLVVDSVTGPTGLTGTSRFVSLSPGPTHSARVLAVAGSTFTPSNTVSVNLPIFKPIAPVLSGPSGSLIGLTGVTFSWSGSTSNVPLTYSLVVDSVTGPTGLTGTSRFVSLSPGPTHSCQVVAVAGSTFTASNTLSVQLPSLFKPAAPVLAGPTGSNIGPLGATFSWSGSTSNVPLTYSVLVDGVTGLTGLTGTSRFVSVPGGTHSCQVVAVAGSTFTPSNTVSVNIPVFKPKAPVLSGPTGADLSGIGATLRWSGSTSNVPLTYSIIVNSITGPTGLTGTSRFVTLSQDVTHTCQVLAVAGSTSTASNTVNVNLPGVLAPTLPVFSNTPAIDAFGATLSWSASTSNAPVTYSLIVNGETGPTGITGTSKYLTLSPGMVNVIHVVAVAGSKSTICQNSATVVIEILEPTQPLLTFNKSSTGGTLTWDESFTNDTPVTYSIINEEMEPYLAGGNPLVNLTATSIFVPLSPGDYYLLVLATTKAGYTVLSDMMPVTI
jgi:hypothetical protein